MNTHSRSCHTHRENAAMGTPKDSERTRGRLIEAAGQLFAERGFKGVTVRDIMARAGTSLSAMNYHFQSKEALYHEVVIAACREGLLTESERQELLALLPEEALHAWIQGAVDYYRKQSGAAWQSALVTREAREPSAAFAETMEVYYRPEAEFMAQLIGHAVSSPPDDPRVQFATVVLTTLVDTLGEYERLIDVITPNLNAHLREGDRLANYLFELALCAAGSDKGES